MELTKCNKKKLEAVIEIITSMKNILCILLFLILLSTATAKPVDNVKAWNVAERFFVEHTGYEALLKALTMPDSLAGTMYVFVAQPNGFVIISADDCAVPILGYSLNNGFTFDNMPPHVAAWLHDIKVAVEYARDVSPMPKASEEWYRWQLDQPIKEASTYTPVQPLLTTQWNQHPYYNALCPINPADSVQAPAGCVAVAMGQIMKYWGYPQSGRGTISYSLPRYGTISANLDSSVYDWNNMPDSLTALTPDTQVYAVARLLYDAGVSVQMAYTNSASGSQTQSYNQISAPCAENALRSAFGYSQSLHVENLENTFSYENWNEKLRFEINSGRPVLYSGVDPWSGGHAFVLDGYDSTGLFHINFGWGGLYDGYYLGNLVITTYYNFIFYRTAIVGISPASSFQDSVTINAASSDTTMGRVEGTGRYATYSDTVSLLATANEGYKFIGWEDGSMYNPRIFIPNEDCSYTALFTKVDSTVLSYCYNYSYASAWLEDSASQWGVKFPVSSMQRVSSLKEIKLHISQDGDYTFVVYQGGDDQPEQEVTRFTKHLTLGWYNHPDDIQTCRLDSPYPIDRSRPLWITVVADSAKAAVGFYSGNRDGMMVKGDSGWYSLNDIGDYFSWILYAEFYSRAKYRVEAMLDSPNAGYILGVDSNNYSYFLSGDTATLTVVCTGFDPETGHPYRFVNWSDGSTDNPYTFVVDRNITLVAHVEPNMEESIDNVSSPTPKVWALGSDINVDCYGIPSTIEIYDAIGRMVHTTNSPSATVTMLSSGIFLVKTTNTTGSKTYKVICR